MRFKLVAAGLVVLVVVAAGCGGSKKKSAAPPTTSTAATTATVSSTTTTSASTSTSSSPSTPSFASAKNCVQLASLGRKVSAAMAASAGTGTSNLDAEVNAFKALADAAPSEIRGDFQTFESAFVTFAQAYGKSGFKPGQTPSAAQIAALTAAAKSLSTPKLQAAEQHLSAWAAKNCGASLTTTN